MCRRALLLLCVIATVARAEQLFVPLDEQGNPITDETSTSGAQADAPEPAAEEAPAARLARESLEAEYRAQVESLTQAYVGCLAEESGRLFGADYAQCASGRSQLHALYPAEYAERVLDCVEIAVLGKALSGAAECGLVAERPAEVVSASRWR